jgi:hypothetical protein
MQPMQTQTRLSRTQMLGLAFLAFVVVFVLWQMPSSWFIPALILYPLRLFVTFVHETGHGLTAIVTGGAFINFIVYDNGGGLAYTAGGNRFLILQMGYVGAALFGAVLIYLANRMRRTNVLIFCIGLYMTGSALLFSHGGRLTLVLGVGVAVVLWLLGEHYRRYSGWLWTLAWLCLIGTAALMFAGSDKALVVGLLGGAVLMGMGIFAPRTVNIVILNVLAFATGLNALNDIWVLTHLGPGVTSDASMSGDLTGIPAMFFVGVWATLAVLLIGGAVYLTFIRKDTTTEIA